MKTVHRILLCGVLAATLWQASAQNLRQTASTTGSETSPEKVGPANDAKFMRGFPIHEVNPQYLVKPRKKKAQGKIVLRATIATDGSVKDISVESGDPLLVPAAVDAVRQWRYLPNMRNGEAIESQTSVTLNYDLGNGASQPEDSSSKVPREPQEI